MRFRGFRAQGVLWVVLVVLFVGSPTVPDGFLGSQGSAPRVGQLTVSAAPEVPGAPSLSSGSVRIIVDNDYALFLGDVVNATELRHQNNVWWGDQLAQAATIDIGGGGDYVYLVAMGGGGAENFGGTVNNVNLTTISTMQRATAGVACGGSASDGWFLITGCIPGYDLESVANGTQDVALADLRSALSGATWGPMPTPDAGGDQCYVGAQGSFENGDQTGTCYVTPSEHAVVVRFPKSSLRFPLAGDGQVTFFWGAPATGGLPISYTVTAFLASDGSITNHSCSTTDLSDLQCTVTGLTNGTAYTFQVVATNQSGNGPASVSTVNLTPRTPPDTTAPVLVSAATNASGTAIVLTYDEVLSPTTSPTSAFTVTAGGVPVTVASLFVSGSTVVLTLGSPVRPGQAITVTYTDPTAANDEFAVQDLSGNDAASFTVIPVLNNVTFAIGAVVTQPEATTRPSTPPTPVVPRPVPGLNGVVPRLSAGDHEVLVCAATTEDVKSADCVQEVVEVVVENADQDLVVRGSDFALRVSGECASACRLRSVGEGRQSVELEVGGAVRIAGTGFAPGSVANAWLFSDPKFLGSVEVNPDGSFAGSLPIGQIEIGEHTIQVNGVSADGRVRSVSLGIMIRESLGTGTVFELPQAGVDRRDQVAAWSVLFLALGALMWLVARRPEDDYAGR
jgi:uncharacterized repeat protein (TIGR02059 family)